MRRWAVICVALTLAVGCNESVARVIAIELIDPTSGDNPAAGIPSGTVTVEVEQGGDDLCSGDLCTAPIENGQFTLDVPVTESTDLTRARARIEGGPSPLLGASPFFNSLESLGAMVGQESLVVRVPMLSAGTCTLFDAPGDAVSGPPRLVAPGRDIGVAARRGIAFLVGGELSDEVRRYQRWDQVTSNLLPLEGELPALGPTRGLTITENLSLFVGDGGAVALIPQESNPPLAVELTLHAAASHSSALHVLDETVAVIGGDGTSEVTWLPVVRLDPFTHRFGEPASSRMLAARTEPAVAPFEDGLLVVGGAEPGASAAEIVRPNRNGEAAPFGFDVEGAGGFLLASPSQRVYLWVGRRLDDGTIAEDTVLITGCPDSCVASLDGPTWEDPRGASGTWTSAGAFWLVGGGEAPSARTDRVIWAGDEPLIERGPDLANGRAGASVVENASGIITVIGGLGSASLRDDLELCLPSGGLDPF